MNEVTQTNQPGSTINKSSISLSIGLIGMLIVICGTLISTGLTQKILYLVGAVFMLSSAAMERQTFLVILQVVIVSGTVVAFTHWPYLAKSIIPIAFSIAALFYFYFTGALRDRVTQIGCGGLMAIALGFANSDPIIYFIGGTLLAIYGFGSYKRGIKIALLWAILNAIFALTSLVAIYHWIQAR